VDSKPQKICTYIYIYLMQWYHNLVTFIQRVSLFFYREMIGGLVGWVSVQEPSFSLWKSICTTDRFVLRLLNPLCFWGKTNVRKTRIESGFTSVPGQEAEYGFSGSITTKKSTKNPKQTHYHFSFKNSILKQSVKLTLEKK